MLSEMYPFVTTYSDMPNEPQADPAVLFSFIENELKDCTRLLVEERRSRHQRLYSGSMDTGGSSLCWCASI